VIFAALPPPPPAASCLGRVAVVGGGVAGLTAAFRLRQAGLHVTVFDAGQVGGSVRSYLEEGFFWEAGAASLQVRVHPSCEGRR
jgi:oxygen-dependent protoporphyrinogen oxidase